MSLNYPKWEATPNVAKILGNRGVDGWPTDFDKLSPEEKVATGDALRVREAAIVALLEALPGEEMTS